MTPEQLQAMLARKGGRRNKYNVAPVEQREYRGRVYASKAERQYAEFIRLDPEVAEVVDQPKVRLGPDFTYRPDFLVVPRQGHPYYVDVKGVETKEFATVRRLWPKYGRLPLVIVKARKPNEHIEGNYAGAIASAP